MTPPNEVVAASLVRSMRGGADSYLVLADDSPYVVKFIQNPQGTRVLANELLATSLAKYLGLPVPSMAIVHVSDLLASTLNERRGLKHPDVPAVQAGRHFGSHFVGGLMPGKTLDYLPVEMYSQVSNIHIFAGALAFDKWTCNADGRQCVFVKSSRETSYYAYMIDQGYCFNEPDNWIFKDAPFRGRHQREVVYAGISGRESFEPWLGKIESMQLDELWAAARHVPPEWYCFDHDGLERMVVTLYARRLRVWELVLETRGARPLNFPRWQV